MPRAVSPAVEAARRILRDQGSAAEAPALAEALIRERQFGYARRLLARARRDVTLYADAEAEQERLRLRLAQRHALATYKDPDLPPDARLDRACAILEEGDDLRTTTNQETLGLAGAIHKRRWELDGQKQHLERSLAYYARGYAGGPENDYGYTGINAAFALDLLANLEEQEAGRAGTRSAGAAARRAEAAAIRERILTTLLDLVGREPARPGGTPLEAQWWFLATLAEAAFGLGRYEEARAWLRKAAALPDVPEWEFESTARQLACLARLHRPDASGDGATSVPDEQAGHPEAWDVLTEFLGGNAAAVQSAFTGRVGLALSGGGFRASLYHVGVLARLAELDMLRHVEVLSCVSGGSIIGAHYYLEVRKLLQEKTDHEITREDYVDIVRRIERDFLAGVQRNIRTRVAADWVTNLKMIFSPDYSRTNRVGELYESELFARVADGEGEAPRWMDELMIRPKGAPARFSPKQHNWLRAAKVPVLILNATSLNTGHNWQFTASWMGEPPAGIDSEIDGNYRLRRMYYPDAPERYRKIRLGHAVAASSCVPGLFEPLSLPELYPDRTVRLVDGGVHDNQGAAGLLEQGCSVLLVSDASGQMDSEDYPSKGLLGVPLRSNGILQARVREAQFHELDARRRSGLLQGLLFVHLKMELEVNPVDWIECPDPYDPEDEGLAAAECAPEDDPLTSYGIRKAVQRKLAAVRTDLDSFSDAEAYALMASGYRMTDRAFPRAIRDFPPPEGARAEWRFLEVDPLLNGALASPGFLKQLDAAKGRVFKIWKLDGRLRAAGIALGAAAFLLLGWLFYSRWTDDLFALSYGAVGLTVLTFLATSILGSQIVRIVRYRKTLREIGVGLGLSFGFLLALLHLYLFDRWFLRHGRLERVLAAAPRPADPGPGEPAPAAPQAEAVTAR